MMPFDLRGARLNQGLTLQDAADRAQVSPATLSRLENGKRVGPANAKLIAESFGVQVTDIPPFAPNPPGSGPTPVPQWRAEADAVDRASSSEISEQVR